MNLLTITLALGDIHSDVLHREYPVIDGHRIGSSPNPRQDVVRSEARAIQADLYLYFSSSDLQDMPGTAIVRRVCGCGRASVGRGRMSDGRAKYGRQKKHNLIRFPREL